MKKKLFVGIASGVLAAAMCVSFAACGGSGVDAKSVNGEQVTAEEWNAALELLQENDTDMTVEYLEEVAYETKSGDKQDGREVTERWTCVKKGLVICLSGYNEVKLLGESKEMAELAGRLTSYKDEFEKYTEITDTGLYNYEKDGEGNWSKEHGSLDDSALADMLDYIEPLIGSFEDYEFSEEYKGYVKKVVEHEEGGAPMIYKFRDKKLAAVYQAYDYSQSNNGTSTTRKYTLNIVCKYEAKELSLPEVAE